MNIYEIETCNDHIRKVWCAFVLPGNRGLGKTIQKKLHLLPIQMRWVRCPLVKKNLQGLPPFWDIVPIRRETGTVTVFIYQKMKQRVLGKHISMGFAKWVSTMQELYRQNRGSGKKTTCIKPSVLASLRQQQRVSVPT